MAITLEQAKSLAHDQTIYADTYNRQGQPHKWRVSGKVKTWVRSPGRVQVPIKHGLYENWYLSESNLDSFYLTEQEALGARG